MTEPCHLTASQALHQIQQNSLTVTEYATSLLNRIRTRDYETQAWTYLRPSSVLEAAKALDALPISERGPLHGVCVAVKDVILTEDMPTSFNSPIYSVPNIKNGNSKEGESWSIGDDKGGLYGVDAAPIITLRAMGALIMGKTVTTEFAATTKGGKARNPFDTERTPGGSSSGVGLWWAISGPNFVRDANGGKYDSTREFLWNLCF